MVPLYSILVRRDAHTTTPVTVPEYELPLLQEIFGVENVHNAEGKRIDEKGLGKSTGQFKASGDEYGRFCAKYGVELVEQVFGKSRAALNKQVNDKKKSKAPNANTGTDAGTAGTDAGNKTE